MPVSQSWYVQAPSGGDPFFSKVVNLSHFDGTNGSTTYVDNSQYAINLAAGTGDSLSTSTFKFGSASVNVTGSLSGPGGIQSIYSIGTQDFTVEAWLYFSTSASNVFSIVWNGGGGNDCVGTNTSSELVLEQGGTNRVVGSTVITTAAWHFVAYSRSSSTGVLYLDGASQGSWADSTNYNIGNEIVLGRTTGGTNSMVGFIDDFRFTIGVGRYPSTCPVPTAPFPNHS